MLKLSQLSGFNFGRRGAKHIATAVTTQAGAGTSVAATVPAGIMAGDLLVAFISSGGAGSNVSTPSGWNLLDSQFYNGTNRKHYVFWKISNGSETSQTFNTDTGSQFVVTISAFREHAGFDSALSKRSNASSVNIVADSITPNDSPVILAMFCTTELMSGSITAPSGFSVAGQGTLPSNVVTAGVCLKSVDTNAPTGQVTATGSAAAVNGAILCSIK